MADRYAHLLSFVTEHPWAITESVRLIIAGVLARRIAGEEADPTVIEAALVNRKNLPQPTQGGGVAIIPVYGVIAPRMNLMSQMSGGTTYETLSAQLREAMAAPSVKTVVFDIDSPGGNVAGATEFAREIMQARRKKPIIAQAQHTMASAAYWLAASATEIVASPSSSIGSIGVVTMHSDISESLAKLGIKREVISAGKYKAEGFDGGPLSDEARDHIKALVDGAYGRMVADIAKGRGVDVDVVKSGYGEGRAVGATEAKKLGMVDAIGTLDETVARVMAGEAQMQAIAAERAFQAELLSLGL